MNRLIVIGASAGGVPALINLATALPADFPAPVLVVLHVGAHRSLMPELLASRGELPASHATDGQAITAGHIHLAPPDHHMLVSGDQLRLTRGPKEHHSRPAVDPLFLSAALAHGPAVVGVVLTGMLDDGTAGLQAIKLCGGTAVVQDPRDAFAPSMPMSALRYVEVDHCLPLAGLPALLRSLAAQPASTAGGGAPGHLVREYDVAVGRGDAMEHLSAIGKPSPFACPDCHGGLWEIDGAKPPRYRCHTGHAFTLRTLQHVLSVATEDALWSALRALEEKRMLLQHMAAEPDGSGDAAELTRLKNAIGEIEQQEALLRRSLEAAPEPIE